MTPTNPPQYSISEILKTYAKASAKIDYWKTDLNSPVGYRKRKINSEAEQAINQLIYTQVLELIPEKVDMKQVPYQKDIQPQYYVAGFNQAIDDMTERIKAKYIGASE